MFSHKGSVKQFITGTEV